MTVTCDFPVKFTESNYLSQFDLNYGKRSGITL